MSSPSSIDKSSTPVDPVSAQTFHIAGILTTVYGLEELAPALSAPGASLATSSIRELYINYFTLQAWLASPEFVTADTSNPATLNLANVLAVADTASNCINDWNQRAAASKTGLIAVSFDQRNHGTRQVHALANGAWKQGNKMHAPDMFSILNGTAIDTSLLIDHLGSYILLNAGSPTIRQHLVLGVSLGGHSAWQLLFNEPRVTAAVVIVGCPDYMRVMSDRARLSKLETYQSSNGATFLGSKDFPKALISSVQRHDPRGILFGTKEVNPSPSGAEQKRIREILDAKIKDKRVLVCSGGDDKLVPYHCSEPFLQFLKNAAHGWYRDGNVYVEDIVYPGVGHAYVASMAKDSSKFVCDVLAQSTGVKRASEL